VRLFSLSLSLALSIPEDIIAFIRKEHICYPIAAGVMMLQGQFQRK
jgi:hypothetical protein